MNIKRKLTSRKFWAAIIGFVTAIITAFHPNGITAEQVQLILGALAVLISYIFGEGFADKGNIQTGISDNQKEINGLIDDVTMLPVNDDDASIFEDGDGL